MANSQNGWPAATSASSMVNFPWVTGRVRGGDVYVVLDYLARRFNAEVEGIEAWQSWGWNYRAVRGATALSNHASGTAVDFNATRHVLGRRGTFSAAQVAAIRRILSSLDGTVRWGGDYTSRPDEMHFEINASPARVASVARSVVAGTVSNPIGGGGSAPAPNIPGAPAPITPTDWFDMATEQQLREAIQWTLFNTRGPDGRNLLDSAAQIRADLGTVHSAVRDVKADVANVPYRTGVELRVDGRNIFDWFKQTRSEQAAGFAAVSGQTPATDVAGLARAIADQLPDDLARQVADVLASRLKD